MAKRFTDSAKWDHAWFRKLSPKMKCVWFYLLDKCDHAGVWTADLESLSFHVGEAVTLTNLTESFEGKLSRVGDDKFVITSFIDFQYGSLNSENRVHQSVISRLEKIGLNKDLTSPLKGAKDKDKEKDKDKAKEKERKKQISESLAAIYKNLYPLKKGKSAGLKTLAKEICNDEGVAQFAIAVQKYAADCVKRKVAPDYIKYFSTFANEWKDWLETDAGTAVTDPPPEEPLDESLFDKEPA